MIDNHGGNTVNVSAEALPAGARLETWRDFDLRVHEVEAMFQVGYHPRGGVEGFLSHTYVPGLRLRVDGELISESHGRAWASGVPLLGITGNDLHQQTIGSLSNTPFLVVQKSLGRSAMQPRWNVEEGLEAIRDFAERCMRMPPPRHRVAHRGTGLRGQHAERSRSRRSDGSCGLGSDRRRNLRGPLQDMGGRT